MQNNIKTAGLYVHIPFCLKKCAYCDFYSLPYSEELASKYVDALTEEFRLLSARYEGYIYDTVYFGGGTPGILPARLFEKLVNNLYKYANFQIKEWTVETNPSLKNNFSFYRSVGVNRVSVGVQSLNNSVLRVAGRMHNASVALATLQQASKYFDHVSADLMAGLPFQTVKDIEDALAGIMPYVKHISLYLLKLSDVSPMKTACDRGEYSLPDDDASADMYNFAYDYMKERAFERYEISNFAFGGAYSLHNMKYWKREDYMGIGAAAASFLDGVRYENPADILKYISGENLGNNKAKSERITAHDALFEEIMLSLRLTEGIDIAAINQKFNINFINEYRSAIKASRGLLIYENGRLFIRPDAMLLQNSILMPFLQ